VALWVPPKVHADILDERAKHDAMQLEGMYVEAICDRYTRELQRIDPHLCLMRAKDDATVPGLRPGYYHVVRHNPDAPVWIEVLEGPAGEFMEPDSSVFSLVEKSDMWNTRALRVRQKKELDAARSKQRDREREAEDRVDELAERWKQANSDQILVKELPWSR